MTGVNGTPRLFPAILAFFLLAATGLSLPETSWSDAGGGKIRLFGTVEFKAQIRALPKWLRVLSQIKGNPGLMPSPSLSANKKLKAVARLEKIKASVDKGDWMPTLRRVNAFFNMFPYRLDKDAYGVSDYWATPDEFVRKYGDCEDFSIIKYYALKEMGFPVDLMRIAVVKDLIRGIGHAVLVVYLDDTAYVLDNMSDMVLPHGKFKHYLPQYSVNEKYRWAHVPPKKQ